MTAFARTGLPWQLEVDALAATIAGARVRSRGDVSMRLVATNGGGTFLLAPGRTNAQGSSQGTAALGAFVIGSADIAAQFEVEAEFMTNATDPGAALVYAVGLYPISAIAGAASNSILPTLGAVVSGSVVSRTNIGANCLGWKSGDVQPKSGLFTVATPGMYLIAAVCSGGNVATNSSVDIISRLMRTPT